MTLTTKATLSGVRWPLRRVLVEGPSMVPTLRHGDQLLVWYDAPVAPGDVVMIELPGRPLAVKRLIRRDGAGGVWIEGDNPFGSTDSRELGTLPAASVRGRVVARIWPRPRRGRGLKPPPNRSN
jgi:SOS-response transcriptional repressor LexA